MNELLQNIKPVNGIAEMIYISCLAGDFHSPIIFIRDQLKAGHRESLVRAIGEEIVKKVEHYYKINETKENNERELFRLS